MRSLRDARQRYVAGYLDSRTAKLTRNGRRALLIARVMAARHKGASATNRPGGSPEHVEEWFALFSSFELLLSSS
jgi:hypothetical protein